MHVESNIHIRIASNYLNAKCTHINYGTSDSIDCMDLLGLVYSGRRNIAEYSLMLTPLSEVSDEQAIAIATIMCNAYGGINKSPTVERVDDRIKIWTGGRGVCSIWFNGELNWSDVENRNLNTSIQARMAYDYCRKNSIDVGYDDIDSLIKARIAVKSTNV